MSLPSFLRVCYPRPSTTPRKVDISPRENINCQSGGLHVLGWGGGYMIGWNYLWGGSRNPLSKGDPRRHRDVRDTMLEMVLASGEGEGAEPLRW